MTDIFTDQTTDFDGSGSPAAMAATGTLQVTFSGTTSGAAALQLWARTDAADYAPLLPADKSNKLGIYAFDLGIATDYYFTLKGVVAGDSLDVSAVEV